MASNLSARFWVCAGLVVCLGGTASFVAARWLRGGAVEGSQRQDRIASICRIAHEGRPGAAGTLLRAAAADGDVAVRRAALACMGPYAGQIGAARIMEFTNDAEPQIRLVAVTVLAHCAEEAGAQRLREIAGQDEDQAVRLTALDALLAQGTPAAIVALVETMENSTDRAAKLRAAYLLVKRLKIAARPDPDKTDWWNHLVEVVKKQEFIERCYQKAGKTLVHHPERQLTRRPA